MPKYFLPLLALLCLPAAEVGAGAPLEAYGHLPTLEEVALSPDGSRVAMVQTNGDQRFVSIVSLSDSVLLGGVRLREQKLREIKWADNDRLLLTTSSTGLPIEFVGRNYEWSTMQVYDLKTKKVRGLLDKGTSGIDTLNTVSGVPMIRRIKGETILFLEGVYVEERTLPALFKVDLDTGTERIIKQGTSATRGWMVSESGEVVAEDAYYESERRWVIRVLRDGRLRDAVSGVEAIDSPSILGFDPAGAALVVTVKDTDGYHWKRLMMDTGQWGPELSPETEANETIRDPSNERIIGEGDVGDAAKYRFFDPELQDRWNWAVRVFGGDRVEYLAMTDDRKKFLVRVTGPRNGYAFHIADLSQRVTVSVGKVYRDVDEIAEVRLITYKAADGMEIPAYLTLPRGRQPKNLPIVVLPHGGPEAHDQMGFDWWSQALAAQGYAVLQPNFRGSDLNWKFLEAGFGEWGRKMQGDLSDGLRYLANQGIADPKRACIVGASYGGYAALAGVSLESGVYRCAVSVSGISDPAKFLSWVQMDSKQGYRYLGRFLGVAKPEDRRLDEISPIKHVSAIETPLMLIHGRDDTVVPYEQSEMLVKAMKRAGKPVEFVSLDKEDHWLSRGATRLKMLQASVEFLRKYNPPD